MASFTIHGTTGAPLIQFGTASADVFSTAGIQGLLAPGLAQNALGGFDTLNLRGLGPLVVTDAAFAGLLNFERLDLASLSATSITLSANAALAFGGMMELRAFRGTLTLDGTALSATTQLLVRGGQAGDSLTGGAGDDRLLGRVGDDTIEGGGGHDTLFGGTGEDALSGGDGNDQLFGEAGQDSLSGGEGQDRLGGGEGDDVLEGGAGQDTLLGNAGDDILRGDAGADVLRGGEGLDLIDGGTGDDVLEGGAEADVFRLSAGTDFISDFNLAEGDRLDVSGLEIRNLAQFQAIATQVGTTLRINTAPGEVTRLRNVTLADLGADDLILAAGRAPTDIAFAAGPLIVTGAANGGTGLSGVGILTATDPDAGDSITFTVDDPRFTIAFGAFLWVAGTPFDFADQASVTLNITATDSYGLSYSEAFTIAVSAPGLGTNNLTVSENLSAGAVVGTWQALDFIPVGEVSFEVVTVGSAFTFDGDRLVTTQTLDFETLASHDIIVRLRDSGADPDDASDDRVLVRSVTITVEDRDDVGIVLAVTRDLPDPVLPGTSSDLTLFDAADSVTGSFMPDRFSLVGSVTGGNGMAGLNGSPGAAGAETFIFGPVINTRVVQDGADGAAGGAGTAGGAATARAGSLTARLGNDPAALADDMFLLEITARAGSGGQGAVGGAGGNSALEADHTDVNANTGAVIAGVNDTTGQGGMGGAGGAGGAGGEAEALLIGFDASFTNRAALTLNSTALGGAGGDGSQGGAGGIGRFDADLSLAGDGGEGGVGGAGGRGGDAISLVAAAGGGFGGGDLSFTIFSIARGGQGGQGGAGGAPGINQSTVSETQFGEEIISITDITTGRDIGGAGGRGGDGGDAAAIINDLRIGGYVANPASTLVRLQAEATAGMGGAGGLGSTDIGEDGVAGDGFMTETSFAGIAGADGAAGAQGTASITMGINHIYLEGGDDVLQIAAFFSGATHELTFVGNVFDGGAGDDHLDLSAFYGFAVTLDVAQNRMMFGTSPWNSVSGFESFHGTEGDDVFLDGADAQVYEGGSGRDRFAFAAGHGNDSIRDFTQGEDEIDFSAFAGVGFADLQITYGGDGTPSDPAYVVVSANAGSDSISISLGAPTTLAASDFIFA
ncbi:hypothetical protein [Sediminicoccus sp. KRV36]|uniref:hypothetical protein n=1 Tax=Sediminicoccus sp. KRV36 TaxID=3133721 RepID=UPI0024B215B6|nr:hypothetical protein [Sediminicoccus rosea]